MPLCDECYSESRPSNDDVCKIARSLANDNFYGCTYADLVKHRVRWIEVAAASPVLTCLVAYYIEGDHCHLLDERIYQRTDSLVARGNCYSFQMPWERIIENLNALLEETRAGMHYLMTKVLWPALYCSICALAL